MTKTSSEKLKVSMQTYPFECLSISKRASVQPFAMIQTSPWETQGNMTAMQNQAWGGVGKCLESLVSLQNMFYFNDI